MGGAFIPPGVTGMTWPLAFATANPQIAIQAPPAGQPPIGPTPVTSITFSDDVLPPNMGVLQTPQAVANFTLLSFLLGGTPTLSIFTGLARGCCFGVYVNSGAAGSLTVDGSLTLPSGAGTSIQVFHGLTIPSGSNADALFFSFGAGTSMAPNAGGWQFAQTLPMFTAIGLLALTGAGQFTAGGSLFF